MLQYWIWFARHSGLSGLQKRLLLEHFPDPEDIYYAKEDKLPEGREDLKALLAALEDKDLTEAEQIGKDCEDRGIRTVTYGDPEYPGRLQNIDDPPLVLYYRGHLPDFDAQPIIGVVGTRKATAYGLTTARHMSRQIAACGALVISGGAYGIDGVAMQGALDAGKPVIGILGCGVDVLYPKSNRILFDRVLENGCLISEYPPGTPALAWHFPRRNRIISGMSNGVLVVEAPEKSGALITARLAFDQGRDVFVVPGNIDVAACAGSNALLQEHALAVFSGWDVVREYAALYPGKLSRKELPREVSPSQDQAVPQVAQKTSIPEKEILEKKEKIKKTIDNKQNSPYSGIKDIISVLGDDEQILVRCLDSTPKPVDEVIAQSGLPAGKVLSTLTMLALKGMVVNHPGRCVSLKTK